jgi:hypothetical protein
VGVFSSVLKVKNHLRPPKALTVLDFQLMIGGRLHSSLDWMTAFRIDLASGQSFKTVIVNRHNVVLLEKKPFGVEEVNELIEPCDQEFFVGSGFKRELSGFAGPDRLGLCEDEGERMSRLLEKPGQIFSTHPDPEVPCMVDKFESA